MAVEDFSFEGLCIDNVIAHRIFPRAAAKMIKAAKISKNVLSINDEALDALQQRITEALAARSHGVEMSIRPGVADSFLNLSASTFHSDQATFIAVSQRLAAKLTESQFESGAPGGILINVQGVIGENELPFFAVIKAETQTGFSTNENEEQVTIEFLNELLLTPSQRFFKIGFIVENVYAAPDENGNFNADNYRAFLFDHLMTSTNTNKAAAYFYNLFLGMDINKSSKKLTQDFYEVTSKFINEAKISEEEKLNLHEALRAELRSKKQTVSVHDFANDYLPEDLREPYKKVTKETKIPQNSFYKDNDYISAKLKRRSRLVFSNDIWISVPPDNFRELVEILPNEDHNYTLLRINGKLTSKL
ncbi:nucleoid-associated protein [Franconibacter pulveris]|uniref:nucleoid-associated protein n=1 Tax=Cronobacter sakazakii TaxID=28141 RepID=UPI000978CFB5|nr:nucleoid-associated protein [Cronobacter sakazakii]